ncbi:MAG: hypothetical protein PHY77_01105 [Desulfotomaculaceae bacterium]|nr:hypothetical protein [Desulfotomaculaceae bacterium]
MKDLKNTEIKRWRLYALLVTVLGIILFSLPWITTTYKIALTVPLYAMFVYVYYKYLSLKKETQAAAAVKENKPDGQKILPGMNTAGKPAQKGKAAVKKDR